MKKAEFMAELEERLYRLNSSEREEFLNDYEEHFRNGEAEGKSESEIVMSLGSPKAIADDIFAEREELLQDPTKEMETYYVPRQTSSSSRTPGSRVLLFIGLIFLDLVLLIPVAATAWGLVISVWGISGCFILSPAFVGIAMVLGQNIAFYQMFASIAMVGLGLMLLPIAVYFTKWVKNLTLLWIASHGYVLKGGNRYE
ncbi:HAAS signaling domain-containing protein [Listeria costaricensis]|uniref:HAAS signaling domain-containing protein n=1 Tax=Listeria costaricensis TaxID=2026604 RepID=UPI000C089239|nr:DUF1700 domain-containing protein [Listeria costaricensis]